MNFYASRDKRANPLFCYHDTTHDYYGHWNFLLPVLNKRDHLKFMLWGIYSLNLWVTSRSIWQNCPRAVVFNWYAWKWYGVHQWKKGAPRCERNIVLEISGLYPADETLAFVDLIPVIGSLCNGGSLFQYLAARLKYNVAYIDNRYVTIWQTNIWNWWPDTRSLCSWTWQGRMSQ